MSAKQTDQRVCAVYTSGIWCGAPVEPVEGTTKWRHTNRVPVYGHDAQPKLAHPMDTDPFAGVDDE